MIGIVLGAVGVYGVVSHSVQRRSAEFGIRLALGAAPNRLLGDVVRNGMMPVVGGVIAGSLAFLGSTNLTGFLFSVEPSDPASLMAAAIAMLMAGIAASVLPALRARATDPAALLRAD